MGFWGFGFNILFLLFDALGFYQCLSKEKMRCGERMESGPSKELRQTPSAERAREPRGECGVQFAKLRCCAYLQNCKLHACRRVGSTRLLDSKLINLMNYLVNN